MTEKHERFREFYERKTGRKWGDFMRVNPEVGFGELAECMADWLDEVRDRKPNA